MTSEYPTIWRLSCPLLAALLRGILRLPHTIICAALVLSLCDCGPASTQAAEQPAATGASSNGSVLDLPSDMTPRAKEIAQILDLSPTWHKTSVLQDRVQINKAGQQSLESL